MMSANVKKEKQQIQVFVRVRPINVQEIDGRSSVLVEAHGRDIAVKQQYKKNYSFDKAFGPTAKQLDVYKAVVHPMVSEVLAGYNCTVFAYGQTGTGKTFTMAGGSAQSTCSWTDNNTIGIIPRALAHLYEELQLQNQEYTVRVSYLELYNEELFDLLSSVDDNSRVRIYDQKGSIHFQGLEEVIVRDKNEVYKILDKGQEKRRTASTLMNSSSSRSHTVFTITVHTKDVTVSGEELVKTGKLNLVDLAGSENIQRSGSIEMRAREAGSINQSLLTLGRVITSLVEKAPHVPYRESKLTRILQDSLGGRTKTSIIATVSPAACNLEETISTLEYAFRARNIMNRPEVNQRMTRKIVLSQFTEEIDRLRKDLEATRMGTGVCIAKENYDQILYQLESQKTDISEKITQIRNLKERMDDREAEWDALLDSLRLTKERVQTLKTERDTFEEQVDALKRNLSETTVQKREAECLASVYENTELKLVGQARQLKDVVAKAVSDKHKLHDKVDRFYDATKRNKQLGMESFKTLKVHIESIQKYLIDHLKVQQNCYNNLESKINAYNVENINWRNDTTNTVKQCMDSIAKKTGNIVNGLYTAENEVIAKVRNDIDCVSDAHERRVSTNDRILDVLYSLLNEHVTKTAVFCQDLTQDSLRVKENHSKFSQQFLTQFENVTDKMITELNASLTKLDVVETQMVRLKRDIASKHKARDEYFKKMNTEFTKMMNEHEQEQSSMLQTLEKNLLEAKPPLHAATNIANQEGLALIKDYISLTNPQTDESTLLYEKIVAHEEMNLLGGQKLEKEYDTYTVENVENIENCQKCLLDTRINCGQEIHQCVERIIESINDSANDAQNVYLCKINDTLNKRTVKNIEESLDVINNSSDELHRYKSETMYILDECSENCKQFISNIEDVPRTGDTPQRCSYNYPTQIVSSEPRDVILQKFRDRINEDELEQQMLISALSEDNSNSVCRRSLSDINIRDFNKLIKIDANCEAKEDLTRVLPGDIISSKIPVPSTLLPLQMQIENISPNK